MLITLYLSLDYDEEVNDDEETNDDLIDNPFEL